MSTNELFSCFRAGHELDGVQQGLGGHARLAVLPNSRLEVP